MSNTTFTSFEDVRDRFFPGTPISCDENFTSGCRHDKVVVHIPARSRSTRIKDKNIKLLGGVPLIAYTIIIARFLNVDRIILDTDSEEYARIGREYGAETPFLRPPELSDDTISPGVASYYATRRLLEDGYPVGFWIDMYPTAPFRSVPNLKRFMDALYKAGTCISINNIPRPAKHIYQQEIVGPLSVKCEESLTFYKPTGTFVGYALDRNRRFWRHYETITDPMELLDIDTENDFVLAEQIVQRQAYDFGVSICTHTSP